MKYLLSISAVVFTLIFVSIPLVQSDGQFQWRNHEEHEEHEYGYEYGEHEYMMPDDYRYKGDKAEYRQFKTSKPKKDLSALENSQYREACGSCHLAYPAVLLPAVSWEKIMLGLDDHFGKQITLEDEVKSAIKTFLQENSSDNAYYQRSKPFSHENRLEAARTRITESSFFWHKHKEIPAKLVSGNPMVKSFSHCDACHQKAEQGLFSEYEARIAGYGKWDD